MLTWQLLWADLLGSWSTWFQLNKFSASWESSYSCCGVAYGGMIGSTSDMLYNYLYLLYLQVCSLERFRSLQDKLVLLDEAVAGNDGNVITAVSPAGAI